MTTQFHLAFPVKNMEATKKFYADTLGCNITRLTEKWLNIDFFGHQLSIHQHLHTSPDRKRIWVEDKQVPLQHFGVILKKKEWDDLVAKLKSKKTRFLITPRIRHKGQLCEHWMMFLKDPSGHGIEFKCYTHHKSFFSLNC